MVNIWMFDKKNTVNFEAEYDYILIKGDFEYLFCNIACIC